MTYNFEIQEPKDEEEIVREKLRESLNPAILILKEVLESNYA